MKKTLLFSALIALLVTGGTLGIYNLLQPENKVIKIEHIDQTPAKGAVYTVNDQGDVVPLDFTKIAEEVVHAVVHIKSTQTVRGDMDNNPYRMDPEDIPEFFRPFFRFDPPDNQRGPRARVGTGSGVIITEDGYIVTNNHVIDQAEDLEVTLSDNRTFKATVVGADPSTDLALIRIEANDLPTVPILNSDAVKVGEWVLAVGNPMGLNSTVTAGIVSAKGRNINLLREQFAVESFIQTDAAINPGNSGGALVNLSGGLIGINTAIASPTGVYSGYGFAVPSNIVNKVVNDLLEFGTVQRGVLGVMIRSVDGNLAKTKELSVTSGAYVDSLLENSAAGTAGVRVGDVIVKVDDQEINSSSELQETIARHRPGDLVKVTVNRNGKDKVIDVTLNNRAGTTELVKKEKTEVIQLLGAELQAIDKKLADQLNISGGVQVSKLYSGKLRKFTDMREGFIITKVDGQSVRTPEELVKILEHKKGGVLLEGVYEDAPGKRYYAFGMEENG